MRNTILGVVYDQLGLGTRQTLEPGPDRPRLRRAAWANPAAEVRTVQAAKIPVDLDHDGVAVGEVAALIRRSGKVFCIAHVDPRVLPIVRVRVAERSVPLPVDLYFSPLSNATVSGRDIEVLAVSLTASPARVCAEPVKIFLEGELSYRGAHRRWNDQTTYFERELLAAAEDDYLERRRSRGPIVVRGADPEPRLEVVKRGRASAYFAEGELVGVTPGEPRPAGALRRSQSLRGSVLRVS
jgi:hypothetical protein